ncbi:hypothetical protein MMYC01_209829, partial [Madurella mycetomatis]
VSPSLFWPYVEGEEPRGPLWPSLARLTVEFDSASPCGRWYFRAAPGDEHNVPASDEPLPADTAGHMPPGYGSYEDTQRALEYERSMRPVGREGDGTFDSLDDFRTTPDDEVMLPLLEAFARAVAQMPSLKTANLTTPLPDPHIEWFVSYGAPGTRCGYEEYAEEDGVLSKPRFFFHVQDWRPSDQVLDLFRRVGRERSQQDAVIAFLPSLY